MAISVNHALKLGIVSGKAAAKWKKPAILNATRSQRGQMVGFNTPKKDEGVVQNKGIFKKHEIDNPNTQTDRASSMPSTNPGRSKNWGGVARTQSKQGGAVKLGGPPGVKHIDKFEQKPYFPTDSGYGGRGFQRGPISAKTDNTRMKGKTPIKSGGPGGGNASNKHYYGGPRGKDGT